MKSYYDRRAREYDTWYEGTGLFAERDRPGWADELEAVRRLLRELPPVGTLDVACGSGYLTRELRGPVVGLDASPAMLQVAGGRLSGSGACLVRADALALPFRARAFGRVLAGHFYGHLQPAERAVWLAEVRRVARELVLVDTAVREGEPLEQWQERVLADGSRWPVFKRFFTGATLLAEVGAGQVCFEGRWFVVTRHGWS